MVSWPASTTVGEAGHFNCRGDLTDASYGTRRIRGLVIGPMAVRSEKGERDEECGGTTVAAHVPRLSDRSPGRAAHLDAKPRSRSNRNASINLRGLGDENSLTVINGRRTIGFPVPDGTGWNRVDINSLVPKIAVQRAELLLDGGSAIFGSDPVAGVANFVTRNNFRGFDFALDTRTLEEVSDAKNYTASMLFGSGDDSTSIVAAIEFHQEDRVTRNQVDSSFFNTVDVTPETGTGLEEQEGLLYGNGGMGMGAATWVDPLCGDPQFGIFAYIPAYEDEDDEFRETTLDQADFCARPADYDNGFQLINNNVKQLIAFVRAERQSLATDF